LNAGAGVITTSGPLSSGAAQVTSLSAGSGAIVTTGELRGGAASLGSTSTGDLNVSGAVACTSLTSISASATDVLFARSTGGPDKYLRVRGAASDPRTTYAAQIHLENVTRSLARIAGSAFDAAGTDGRLIFSVFKNTAWFDILSARSSGYPCSCQPISARTR
jgi:hypothetical protein